MSKRLKKKLLNICKDCNEGSCCWGGVDVDFTEALKISLLDLDIKKPWFDCLHRDKDLKSGWSVETRIINGRCIFQQEDKRCLIYHVRPGYCAEYPYEDGRLAKSYQEYCSNSNRTKGVIKEVNLPPPI